ncbi:MAG: BMP family protein [Microbacterium sp.]
MRHPSLRRAVLRVVATSILAVCAAAVTACGAGASTGDASTGESGDRPKVAALFTQFVDQGNWDPAGYAAYEAMCEKYDFDCTYTEEATYEQAPALLRQYADDGYDLVIAHSSGYASAMKEVAVDYPDVQFSLFSYETDLEGLDNYSAWSVDWTQQGYLDGIIAGLVSQSGNIYGIGGEQLPSSEETFELMERGAQLENPDAVISQVWIGSFTDIQKGKQLAQQAIADGADFLIPQADMAGQGVQQAADESGTLSLGEYIDESDAYPNSVVTSVLVDFDTAYDEIGQHFVDGDLGGTLVNMDASTGVFSFASFHHVDASVQEAAEAALAGLADGSITAG